MASAKILMSELDERTIARMVAIPHDEARISYYLRKNRVTDFNEYTRVLGDYCNHHFSRCISHGGRLSDAQATSWAKEFVEKEYRRRGGDIVTAYNDAHDGTNGGIRAQLDIIAEGLKAEAIERYIRDTFDHHVAPNSWNTKVEIIRQFIDYCGVHLSNSIRRDQPERYAQNYQELIRSYVTALQQTSSIFRRL